MTNHVVRAQQYIRDRVMADPNSGCWLWDGYLGDGGYARASFDGKNVWAHRLSYAAFNGDPTGLVVMHKCDERSCQNPDHLALGTYRDNARDSMTKGRHARGERQGIAKLTELQVRAILADTTPNNAAIGRKYGISKDHVGHIKKGRLWREIWEDFNGNH